MSDGINSRTEMLLGGDALLRLKSSHVTLFGVGGVGGMCLEALARGGVGHIHIIDADTVDISNMNRQIIAVKSELGNKKVDAACKRVREISDCDITSSCVFVLPDNVEKCVDPSTDFIVDAIDTVSAKLAIIKYAKAHNIPIISSMGIGNRLDPTQIKTGDLFSVTGCPLARVIRKELRKLNIDSLPVVYSTEPPLKTIKDPNADEKSSRTPGSVSFVPPAAGLALAGYVIRSLIK